MSATSVPGEGSTFTFTMKFGIPAGSSSEKSQVGLAADFTPVETPSPFGLPKAWKVQEYASPATISPSDSLKPDTPSAASSASSGLSIRTARTSQRSTGSSQSSIMDPSASLTLQLNPEARFGNNEVTRERPLQSESFSGMAPLMYSILVVCPLRWTREALVTHVQCVLMQNVPRNVRNYRNLEVLYG